MMSSKKMSDSQKITPEFSRRIPLSSLGRAVEETVEATPEERDRLCQRFGLVNLERLVCRYRLTKGKGERVNAKGELEAHATQACIITGEPVDERVRETFSLHFIPQGDMPDDEVLDIETLLAEEADDVPHDGLAIDLGEATAEQLALALNPYPRRDGAGLDQFVDVTPPEGEEELLGDEKPNPFAALAQLKKKK